MFGTQPQLEMIFYAASQLFVVGPDAARAVVSLTELLLPPALSKGSHPGVIIAT